MQELGIAAGLLAVLGAFGAATVMDPEALIYIGLWVCGVGFATGVPTGFIYHVQLYRTLSPRHRLPPRWYVRPLQYNQELQPGQWWPVMGWCYAGAIGFIMVCTGQALIVAALLSGL